MAEALTSQLAAQVTRLRNRRTRPLILELDLTDGLAEGPPADPVSALLTMRQLRLPDILEGLKRARQDDRVRVLVVKVGGSRLGLAKIQELRDAISGFRESGKLAVAWAETFGEFVRGNLPYYLATAFDRIWLQPTGTLGLTSVAVEQVFLHDALAKIGVDYQSAKRHEYKSAADQLTETGFTGPAREAAVRLTESVAEQIAAGIAAARGKAPDEARDLLRRGPFLARQALDEGLVDELGYRDEVYDSARKAAGADATLLYLQRYQRAHALAGLSRRVQAAGQRERFVAVIYAHGLIRSGRSGRGPVGGNGMGSDTIGAALRAAVADEQARAIVLRVNSPGGSATASDTIWREVVRVRAAGKPVVVSMGDVAASGGYFISAPADVIVAQPGTLTGSIGVIMGKPVLREMFGRIGVNAEAISQGSGSAERNGDNATMFSLSRPFTEAEWDRINVWLDAIYADFTQKVASGRRLPLERVNELARGRVWTGADAVANGLADEIGGLSEAIATARRRAGLPASAPVRVFPKLGPLDQLRPAESSEAVPAAAARLGLAGTLGLPELAAAFADGWGPAWQLAVRAGWPPYGPLLLPGAWRINLSRTDPWFPRRRAAESALAGSAAPLIDDGHNRRVTLTDSVPAGTDLGTALTAWATGVTLVTIADGHDDIGTTVSAFCPVSFDPPMVLISLMAESYPAEVLSRPSLPAARFAVTLLAASQRVLAGRFAAAGRPSARLLLDDVPHARGADSGALIPDGGLAALECSVARRVPAGDHLLVISAVTGVAYVAASGDPLIRFRGRYPAVPETGS